MFYIRIKNAALPRREDTESAFQKAHGKQDDLSLLQTFGSRIWVTELTPANIRGKYPVDTCKGIFLGYRSGTYKNVIWYDEQTHRIKYGYHGRIDEGYNDLARDDLPPNVRIFERHGIDIQPDKAATQVLQFDTSANPFFKEVEVTVKNRCRSTTFGFQLQTDELLNRVYIQDIRSASSAASIAVSHHKANCYRGAYITDIDDTAIFTLEDALNQFADLR